MKSTKAVVLASLIAVLIIAGALAYSANSTYAVGNFGGKIVSVQFCWCTANMLIRVAGYNGGQLIFNPGSSILYAFGQIFRVGPDVLGIKGGASVCRFGTCIDPGTITIPGEHIIMIGTSL